MIYLLASAVLGMLSAVVVGIPLSSALAVVLSTLTSYLILNELYAIIDEKDYRNWFGWSYIGVLLIAMLLLNAGLRWSQIPCLVVSIILYIAVAVMYGIGKYIFKEDKEDVDNPSDK